MTLITANCCFAVILVVFRLLVAAFRSLSCWTMLSRVPIEYPNSVYRADSAQMFIQTQNDGKNKLNRVYWQMRCGVINMACHTAVVRCEFYSSKTFKNISRAGIMARTQDHLKCECQKIFRSQLLCCSYYR